MNSSLKMFLEENGIEMHNCGDEILACVPFYLLEDFTHACHNDECEYDFDSDEAYPIHIRKDNAWIDLVDIIEVLEEDIEEYRKMCSI